MIDPDRERRFYERLVDCLEADEEDASGHRAAMLADFPEFAGALRHYFDGRSELERIAAPWRRTPSRPSTITLGSRRGEDGPSALPQFAQYEVIREVSRGGMGVVYAVMHRGLGRSAALKMIRSGDLATDEDVRRFREEARRVAQLDHPHIVPLFDAGQEDGRPYFTMKLMEGGSLADRIADGRLGPRRAAEVMSRIALAVHFAHQRGILHRDIKPANILFDGDGNPRIGDFGLASPIDRGHSAARSGLLVGTPMYMAPEQARRDGALTTAVDVYGLGAVLYELIAGRPPFVADGLLETLVEVTRRRPKPPRLLDPRVDVDLETICLKCLEKEPAARYGSAEALADDLDRWLRGEPILARRIPAWRRAIKWARRSPFVASLTLIAAAASLAFVAALVAGIVIIDREKGAKTRALEALGSIRDHERRLTYLQGIALVDLELRAGDPRRAETLLANCPADLRGPEWHYLARQGHGERRSLATARDPACLVVHPGDGRVFVVGGLLGGAGEVAAHDAALRGEPRRLRVQDDAVTAMALSPDGRRMVATARGRRPVVFDLETVAVTAEFDRHDGDVWGVAFSPDGRRVVSGGGDGSVRAWDAATGRESLAVHVPGATVWGVAFSPDGSQIAAAASDRTVTLWDARSGDRPRTFAGHRAMVRSVAFSADGRRLVSASHDQTARIWDVDSGAEVATLAGHRGFVTRAAFSPDGRRVVTTGIDGTVRIWDAEAGEPLLVLRGHSGAVWDAVFRRDGREVVSIGEDGTIKSWSATVHGLPGLLDDPRRRILRMECSADGRVVAVLGADCKLEAWDAEADRRLGTARGFYDEDSRLALSGGGTILAVSVRPGAVKIIRTADGTVLRDITPARGAGPSPALSDDGHFLALAREDRTIGVWDVRDGRELHRVERPEGDLRQLAVGPGARVIAAAIARGPDGPGRVLLWRPGSGPGPVEVAPGSRLALSRGGDLLAAFGDDGAVTVCDTRTGGRRYELGGMARPARAVAFDGPGRLLTGDDRGTVTIWDTRTLREVLTLRDMTAPVDFLALSGGRTLLGATRDGSARRWEFGPVAGRPGDREARSVTLGEEQER